jgi:hypothetical protein
MRLTSSRVRFGVADAVPRVTGGAGLCVQVDKGAETGRVVRVGRQWEAMFTDGLEARSASA